MRVVTLPKEEGGYRGLSIASVMWRLGMIAVMEELREWADVWLAEEFCGGILGRSADELHQRLMGAIDEANIGKGNIYGGK